MESLTNQLDTIMSNYLDIKDISVESAQLALAQLKALGISPQTLFSFALALDALESQEGPDEETPHEYLQQAREADREDDDFVEGIYLDAKTFLCKLGY